MYSLYTPLLNPVCVSCLVKKQIDRYPLNAPRKKVIEYLRCLGSMIADLPEHASGPEIMERISLVRRMVFGEAASAALDGDYAAIKTHFNALVQSHIEEQHLAALVAAAPDPLRAALGLSMIGNFIDFGAMDSVDESKLASLLRSGSEQVSATDPALLALAEELAGARRLVLLTDNCGEIALDALLVKTLHRLYPPLTITVVVRGAPVLNDATMTDAREVGLDHLAGVTLMDNGDCLAGTALSRVSPEALAALESADLILAKGQGNYETLQGCGLPIYYAFLCKCRLFADRFGVPLYTGMLLREPASKGDAL